MNLAANIAPHLPYLRRFSRALTGSQHSGDAYVAALLEALIADPAQFEGGTNMRASLYRSYCRLWESISLNLKKPNISQDWEASAQRQLATIAPQARNGRNQLFAKLSGPCHAAFVSDWVMKNSAYCGFFCELFASSWFSKSVNRSGTGCCATSS